jgi:hypothetical protein
MGRLVLQPSHRQRRCLVNDHAYARRLRERRLEGYLLEEGIRYIVHNLYPRDGVLIDISFESADGFS